MSYVYKFIDSFGNILYIGKTVSIDSRFNTHFTKNGHLPAKCYNETTEVLYSKLNNNDEMSIYERYLINIHTPKYNTQFKNGSNFIFELPSLEWEKLEINKRILPEVENYHENIKSNHTEGINSQSNSNDIKYIINKYIKDEHINLNILLENKMSIACISPNENKVKYIFDNHRIAGEALEVSHSNIYKAARKDNTCGGFWWKFLKDVI